MHVTAENETWGMYAEVKYRLVKTRFGDLRYVLQASLVLRGEYSARG